MEVIVSRVHLGEDAGKGIVGSISFNKDREGGVKVMEDQGCGEGVFAMVMFSVFEVLISRTTPNFHTPNSQTVLDSAAVCTKTILSPPPPHFLIELFHCRKVHQQHGRHLLSRTHQNRSHSCAGLYYLLYVSGILLSLCSYVFSSSFFH